MKKVRFLFGIWRIPRFRCNFSLPSSKKAKTKRFYTPPLGGKKTTEFVSPPKESFGKSKLVWVDFVCKVGVKIDLWPLWTHIWEGGGYSHLFLSRPMLKPMLNPMLKPMLNPMLKPMLKPTFYRCESVPPSIRFFRKFEGFFKKLWTEHMKKMRFLVGIWRIPRFRCNFSSPAAKKRKPKDSIHLCTAQTSKFQ